MSSFERYPRRFRLPWRNREQIGQEVEEEIAFHLAMRADELVADGLDPATAEAQAQREFGDLEHARSTLWRADEEVESRRRRTESLYDLISDLRLAARSLVRGRSATLAAVLTLALGVGAATTVFSLVNWITLRPVPGVADQDRLALVLMENVEGEDETGLSYPNFVDLREAAPSFASMAGYASIALQAAVDDAAPLSLMGEVVAGDYFGTLGVRPFAGRFLSPSEQAGAEPTQTAVISHNLWSSAFAADPGVLGQRIRLNAREFVVIGVAPPGFRGTEQLGQTDVWVTVSAYGLLRHAEGMSSSDRRPGILQELVGRIAPGATPELAQAQLRSAMARLVEAYPIENERYDVYLPTVFPGIGLDVRAREHVGRILSLMLGVVAVVLLITWANVGNLLLLRGVRRRGETAVRRALGASTSRLLRTHWAEGVLLALSGGALGTLLAIWATRLFRGRLIGWLPEIQHIGLDWRVLAFVLGLSLLSSLFFGVIPVWAGPRDSVPQSLKETTRTSTGRTTWLRGALIVAQVSSAMVLLVGALLLARTIQALGRVDLGYDPKGVVTFIVDPSSLGYTPERNQVFREQLHQRLAGVPEIESVSLASSSPFGGMYMSRGVRSADQPESDPVDAWEFSVTPEYLTTLGIPLLSGQVFSAAGPAEQVMISRMLGNRLFGEGDAVGKQVLERNYDGTTTAYTVTGIVGDTRVQDLRVPESDAVLYRPMVNIESWRSPTTVIVRSRRPQFEVEAIVEDAITGLEPSLAIWGTESLSESIAGNVREERLLARMAVLLALLAGFLSTLGLYAVASYAVAQRTREIGIRMALGARIGIIARLVSRESVVVVGTGIALGTVLAILGTSVLESRLYGVERLNPWVFAAAAALFTGATMAALWGPVRAAGRVDPAEALRQD